MAVAGAPAQYMSTAGSCTTPKARILVRIRTDPQCTMHMQRARARAHAHDMHMHMQQHAHATTCTCTCHMCMHVHVHAIMCMSCTCTCTCTYPRVKVRALEAIARELTTPVVNLRRAVGSSLGTWPYTLGRFMKDCRHPGPQGHAWLAQLIVHALQQVDPADAEQVASSPDPSPNPSPDPNPNPGPGPGPGPNPNLTLTLTLSRGHRRGQRPGTARQSLHRGPRRRTACATRR